MSFQLVPKSVTLNDLELRNGHYLQVGLSHGHIVLDGDPNFRPMSMGLGTSDFVLDEPATPAEKESPNFRLMSIVAKRLDGSRCHLAWRWASVQATKRGQGQSLIIFGPFLLWLNGWMHQDAI